MRPGCFSFPPLLSSGDSFLGENGDKASAENSSTVVSTLSHNSIPFLSTLHKIPTRFNWRVIKKMKFLFQKSTRRSLLRAKRCFSRRDRSARRSVKRLRRRTAEASTSTRAPRPPRLAPSTATPTRSTTAVSPLHFIFTGHCSKFPPDKRPPRETRR